MFFTASLFYRSWLRRCYTVYHERWAKSSATTNPYRFCCRNIMNRELILSKSMTEGSTVFAATMLAAWSVCSSGVDFFSGFHASCRDSSPESLVINHNSDCICNIVFHRRTGVCNSTLLTYDGDRAFPVVEHSGVERHAAVTDCF